LDNVGAGHSWPSGATPDRRGWVEINAYAGTDVIYSSGGAAAMPLENSPDPDLWLMRDCLFDAQGNEKHMFWEAVTVGDGHQLPGGIMAVVSDPGSFSRTHIQNVYPGGDTPLSAVPDRITLQMHVQAIGDDVLADLVATGDLDPSIPPQIARFDLGGGGALEWTPAAAQSVRDQMSGLDKLCVTTMRSVGTMTIPAKSAARCAAPAP
jgi:hypothetical protein